jgi:hypothetical protein
VIQIDAQGIENMLINSISIIYDYGEGKRNFEKISSHSSSLVNQLNRF